MSAVALTAMDVTGDAPPGLAEYLEHLLNPQGNCAHVRSASASVLYQVVDERLHSFQDPRARSNPTFLAALGFSALEMTESQLLTPLKFASTATNKRFPMASASGRSRSRHPRHIKRYPESLPDARGPTTRNDLTPTCLLLNQ